MLIVSILVTAFAAITTLYLLFYWLTKSGASAYLVRHPVVALLLLVIVCGGAFTVAHMQPVLTPDDDTPTVSAPAASSNAAQAPADVEKSASAGTLTKGQAFQASLENGTSGLIQAFMYIAVFIVVVGSCGALVLTTMRRKAEKETQLKSGKA